MFSVCDLVGTAHISKNASLTHSRMPVPLPPHLMAPLPPPPPLRVDSSKSNSTKCPVERASGLGRASRDSKVLAGRQPAAVSTAAAAAVAESSGDDAAELLTGWGAAATREAGEEEEEEDEKLVVCQRCYRLRNYGSVEDTLRPGFSDSDLLTPQRFLVRQSHKQ